MLELDSCSYNVSPDSGSDIENPIIDQYGVKYSQDGKRLLKFPHDSSSPITLDEYRIPYGVEIICNKALSYTTLTIHSLFLPESLKCIAHNFPSKIRRVTLPSSLDCIQKLCFGPLVSYTSNSQRFIVDNSLVIDKRNKEIIVSSCIDESSIIEVPDYVTKIRHYAFHPKKQLGTIVLPESILNGNSGLRGSGIEAFRNIIVPTGATEYAKSLISSPNSVIPNPVIFSTLDEKYLKEKAQLKKSRRSYLEGLSDFNANFFEESSAKRDKAMKFSFERGDILFKLSREASQINAVSISNYSLPFSLFQSSTSRKNDLFKLMDAASLKFIGEYLKEYGKRINSSCDSTPINTDDIAMKVMGAVVLERQPTPDAYSSRAIADGMATAAALCIKFFASY